MHRSPGPPTRRLRVCRALGALAVALTLAACGGDPIEFCEGCASPTPVVTTTPTPTATSAAATPTPEPTAAPGP